MNQATTILTFTGFARTISSNYRPHTHRAGVRASWSLRLGAVNFRICSARVRHGVLRLSARFWRKAMDAADREAKAEASKKRGWWNAIRRLFQSNGERASK